jgi:hypothetical protein
MSLVCRRRLIARRCGEDIAFRPLFPPGSSGAGDLPNPPTKFARRRGALARHPSTFDEQRGAPLMITARITGRDALRQLM